MFNHIYFITPFYLALAMLLVKAVGANGNKMSYQGVSPLQAGQPTERLQSDFGHGFVEARIGKGDIRDAVRDQSVAIASHKSVVKVAMPH